MRNFKSNVEKETAATLDELGIRYEYESDNCKFEYTSTYLADFWLPDLRIPLECKGYHINLKAAMSKLLKVKRQNENMGLRMVWENPRVKVPFHKNKRRMTARQWSEKNGLPCMTVDTLVELL